MYTKERANKISYALKGIPKSKEHRKKLSDSAKLKVGSKNAFYGKHHSQETKYKISESHRKYVYCQVDLNTNNIINEFENIDLVYDYVITNKLSQAKKIFGTI